MASLNNLTITIAGAGNVGTFLAEEFSRAGCHVRQIYSRTTDHASELAVKVGAQPISEIKQVNPDTDLIILALPDRVIPGFSQSLSQEAGVSPERTVIASTAGSVGLEELVKTYPKSGILYPLQTFTRYTKPVGMNIPFCIEGADEEIVKLLKRTASLISRDIRDIDSRQRLIIHLAAVFACNFTNHMIAVADKIISRAGLDSDILMPLIDETVSRLKGHNPVQMQTGPAVRGDRNTIDKHLELLGSTEGELLRSLYELISESIVKMKVNKE